MSVMYLGMHPESRSGTSSATEPTEKIHDLLDHFVFSTMYVYGVPWYICCRAILDAVLAIRLFSFS